MNVFSIGEVFVNDMISNQNGFYSALPNLVRVFTNIGCALLGDYIISLGLMSVLSIRRLMTSVGEQLILINGVPDKATNVQIEVEIGRLHALVVSDFVLCERETKRGG